MHEMALVHEVVNVVLAECEGKGVHEVRRVNLAVGETRDVIDAYVPGLFRYIAKDTIAENAEVTIRRIPFTVRCTECGDIFHVDVRDPSTWECPRCHARQKYRMFTGGEFCIESIEVVGEVPDGEETLVAV